MKSGLDASELAAVTGGGPLPAAVATKVGQRAVARAYEQIEADRALRNEASRLWWSGDPNDRTKAQFMLKRAGIPLN